MTDGVAVGMEDGKVRRRSFEVPIAAVHRAAQTISVLLSELFGDDQINRLADHVVTGMAEELLRGLVPVVDVAIVIDHHDRMSHR